MTTRATPKRNGGDVLIGIGANLSSHLGPPRVTCEAALSALEDIGVGVVRRSRWYRSAPVPVSDQPWFINGVAVVATTLGPVELLSAVLAVERRMGRARNRAARQWEARVLDLDILDYRGEIRPSQPELPHPRLHKRKFVLLPLAEVAPNWRHPLLGIRVDGLIAALPTDQEAEPNPD